jgi:predicted O-methyltransferase YrrM
MNSERRRLAAELLAVGRAYDAVQPDRVLRFRNLEPDTAEILGVIVRARDAGRLLELGTSNGYSTMWLADAAENCGAALVSVDTDPARTAMARENLRRAALHPELRTEDAQDTLRNSAKDYWSFIFLDAERSQYASYWSDLLRVLAPGGLLAIDNVLSHATEVEQLTALIVAEPRVTSAVVPVGAGVRLVVRDT